MTTWMTLMSYPARKWILIASTRLEGHALSWYSSHTRRTDLGEPADWRSWTEFCGALRRTFAPLDDEEDARRQLKELRQTGRVAGYTAKFNELCYRIPGLTEKDKFSAYHLGLVPKLQAEVGLRLEGDTQRTVDRATTVATRAEEYLKLHYSKKDGDGKKTGPQKQKGAVNVVTADAANDAGQVNALSSKKKDKKKPKADGGRGGNPRGRGHGRGGRGNRGPPKCYCCDGAHLLHACPVWQQFRNQMRPNAEQAQQGNATPGQSSP